MTSPRLTRSIFIALLLLTSLAAASSLVAGEPKSSINTAKGLALRGYDAVAYMTENRAVPGSAQFVYQWNNANWRFASAANRDAFAKDPERYAPQFGGYCAWAVAHGYTADGDPEAWKVVDGKLYLNYSKRVQRKWEENIPEYIAQGGANWPGVLAK